MHIALITPTSLLDRLCLTGKVQMCLAHRVIEDETYATFYRNASDAGSLVMMDNSLWELGEAMMLTDLMPALEAVRPDELIVPDVFRDGPATQKAFTDFTMQAVAAGFDGPCSEEYPWQRNAVVVHGQDRQEWIECLDFFNDQDNAHTLCLPKVLDEIWQPGGRLGCVTFLEATGRVRADKRYHCLGIWTDPIEVLLLSRHKWIRSLDTALPIHAGMRGVRFDPDFGLSRRRTKRPHKYFGVAYDTLEPHMADIRFNVTTTLEWANGS